MINFRYLLGFFGVVTKSVKIGHSYRCVPARTFCYRYHLKPAWLSHFGVFGTFYRTATGGGKAATYRPVPALYKRAVQGYEPAAGRKCTDRYFIRELVSVRFRYLVN